MKKILLLLFAFVLLFQGCQNFDSSEAQPTLSDDQLIDEVKSWYADSPPVTHKSPRDLTSPYVFWNQAKTYRTGKDRYIVTVPVMKKEASGRSVFNLIAFREKGKIKGFITEVIPSKEFTEGTDRKNFSGQVKLLSKSGKKLRTYKFVNGKEVEFYKNAASTLRTAEEDWQMLEEVIVIAVIPDDDFIIIWVDDYWTYDDETSDDWPIDDDYWYYDDYNNDGNVDTGIPFPVDITNDITDPCIRQQVINAMAGSGSIATAMNGNFGGSEDFNVIFNQSANLPADVGAWTRPYSSGDMSFLSITITFNTTNLANASQEYIYATAIHEFLHAIMDCSASAPSQISESAQHEAMANSSNNYISQMVSALQSQFPNLSTADATNLAWGGLHNTAGWNALSQSQRDAITSTNDNYRSGASGTGCN